MWWKSAWEQSHLTFKNFAFKGYSLCFGGGFLDNKPSLNVKDEQVFPLLLSAKFLIGLSTFSCTLLEPIYSKIKETHSPSTPWGTGNPNHGPEPPSAKSMIRPLLTWRLAKPLCVLTSPASTRGLPSGEASESQTGPYGVNPAPTAVSGHWLCWLLTVVLYRDSKWAEGCCSSIKAYNTSFISSVVCNFWSMIRYFTSNI